MIIMNIYYTKKKLFLETGQYQMRKKIPFHFEETLNLVSTKTLAPYSISLAQAIQLYL